MPGPTALLNTVYAVDDDMVIGLAIHYHQLISQVCLCFIAVSYSHRIVYILMFLKNFKV